MQPAKPNAPHSSLTNRIHIDRLTSKRNRKTRYHGPGPLATLFQGPKLCRRFVRSSVVLSVLSVQHHLFLPTQILADLPPFREYFVSDWRIERCLLSWSFLEGVSCWRNENQLYLRWGQLSAETMDQLPTLDFFGENRRERDPSKQTFGLYVTYTLSVLSRSGGSCV